MSNGTAAVEVEGHDATAAADVDLGRWCEVASSTLDGEGISAGRLDLSFVASDEMAALNHEHMGHDGPTDVLAVPLDGPDLAGGGPAVADPTLHLGDVVVCPEVAAAQAAEHAGSFEAELTLLVVHGVLHVLGHDHATEDERRVMQGRERLHLARYGLVHPVAEGA